MTLKLFFNQFIIRIQMENNYENLNNNESLWGEETQGRLGKLKELVTKRTFELSDIGEFNWWHFIIRDDIKWRDDKWNYIEIKWNRYYQWGLSRNNEWLWYLVERDRSLRSDVLYIWNMRWNIREWFGISYYWKDGKYVGNRKNDKKNWKWTETLLSRWLSYNWEWLEWKKHWKWIYKESDWSTYEWEWDNDKRKEWKWKKYGTYITKNWERKPYIYTGDFLYDKNGVLRPFCGNYEENEKNEENEENKTVYNDWRERQENEQNTQALNNIHMEWKREFPSNRTRHKYKINNWSISEESNDFITMYGDNKRDEDRSAERWDIRYNINYISESQIEYEMISRGRKTTWELEWWIFKFKNKKWKIISIPKDSDFEERDAMHAANLINSVRYINANAHGNRKYRYSVKDGKERLHATKTIVHPVNVGWPVSPITYDGDWTVLIEDVSLHFWWISAKKLADRLNGCL